MSDALSFSLDDLLNKGGSVSKDAPEEVSSDQMSTIVELNEDNNDDAASKKIIDTLGLDKDRDDDSYDSGKDLDRSENEQREESRDTTKKVKRPSLYERQLKTLAEKQDARIKALESALVEKQKKEETLRKVGQELYKYGSLKDQETLSREESSLNEKLREAIYSGNVDKEIEINQRLRDIAAEKYKLNPSMPEYLSDPEEEENLFGEEYYAQQPLDQIEEEQNAAFKKWYSENDWLKIDHLKQKAVDIMESLDGELALDGNMSAIGTAPYFNEINKRMRSQFKKSKMQASGKYGTQPPLPVSNGDGLSDMSSDSDGKDGWRRVKLTPDQIDSAVRVLGFNEQQKGRPLTRSQKIERMQKYIYNSRNIKDDEPIQLW